MNDIHERTRPTTTVVANRLPVQWDRNVGWHRAPGGLVTALSSLPPGTIDWIGSSATLGGPLTPHYTTGFGAIVAVEIDEATVRGAIDGMANRALWPALHGMASRIRDRPAYSDAYRRYNETFTAHIARFCAPGSTVWVHDYHLLLVPGLIKDLRPDVIVGLSLHTPVDDGTLSELAMSSELASAMSRCDLIGVQTVADADRLSAFCSPSGSEPPIVVSPVSIDPDALTPRPTPTGNGTGNDDWSRPAGRGALIVGVDRLDYTKGILERIVAYDLAFQRGDMCPDEVHLVQIAQPSRTALQEYRALRVELERVVHSLNARWLRRDHMPVLDLRIDSLDRSVVLGLLARADVAMVTPLRDGMNLVAKEFSIVAEHRGGVLVLSSSAGAAAELGPHSILVDGACPESVAEGLQSALQLDRPTRLAMAQRRASTVRAWTSSDWAHCFLTRLSAQRAQFHEPTRRTPSGTA